MIAIIAGCVWLIAANVLAVMPSRDNHWSRAYALIIVGLPLLGYITYSNGALVGVVFAIAGASMLRWPVIYLGRWIRRIFGARPE